MHNSEHSICAIARRNTCPHINDSQIKDLPRHPPLGRAHKARVVLIQSREGRVSRCQARTPGLSRNRRCRAGRVAHIPVHPVRLRVAGGACRRRA